MTGMITVKGLITTVLFSSNLSLLANVVRVKCIGQYPGKYPDKQGVFMKEMIKFVS